MKATFDIDDAILTQLEHEAARRGRSMSELVETALRNQFLSQKRPSELPALPVSDGGGELVDIADRGALYRTMEGR